MHTDPATRAEIAILTAALLDGQRAVLGQRLLGLYLFGSLVTGDFDPDVSDIDLLAATEGDITQADFAALEPLHRRLIADQPRWDDRLEVLYYSRQALAGFRAQRHQIAVISPGEPFNLKDAGLEWLMNWYVVRENGLALYGPPPAAIIPPISRAEYVEAVAQHMRAWRVYIASDHAFSRPYQGYAVLTMCRALYTVRHDAPPSKRTAAAWAQREFPAYAALIADALHWRQRFREPVADPAATLPTVRRFVHFMADQLDAAPDQRA
jgi:hypothetical protein